MLAGCLGWFENQGAEQGPNRVFGQAGCSSRVLGQAGCSSRVFAEHPRNRVFESGEQGACGVLESGEQGACGVLGTPSKQGACICPKEMHKRDVENLIKPCEN